jgi:hypothetical protein
MDIALFGRDLELNAGRAFLAAAPARGLLVEGPAGIGKTAVWRALLDIARADGYLVLESIGDAAEARLTFAGLADLLGPVARRGAAATARPAGPRAGGRAAARRCRLAE